LPPAVPPLGHRESLYPSATESPFKLPVFAPSGVKRTAFAEEPETTVVALGGTPGKAYEPDGWELWAPLNRSTRRASTPS
jgi:hypothetical protein